MHAHTHTYALNSGARAMFVMGSLNWRYTKTHRHVCACVHACVCKTFSLNAFASMQRIAVQCVTMCVCIFMRPNLFHTQCCVSCLIYWWDKVPYTSEAHTRKLPNNVVHCVEWKYNKNEKRNTKKMTYICTLWNSPRSCTVGNDFSACEFRCICPKWYAYVYRPLILYCYLFLGLLFFSFSRCFVVCLLVCLLT